MQTTNHNVTRPFRTQKAPSSFRSLRDRTAAPTTSTFHPRYDSTPRTLPTKPEQQFQPRPSTRARKQAEQIDFRSFLNKSTIYSQFLKNRKSTSPESKRGVAHRLSFPTHANKTFESFSSNFLAEGVGKSLEERIQSFKDNITLSLEKPNEVGKRLSSGKGTINTHSHVIFHPGTVSTDVEEEDTVTQLESSSPCWNRDNVLTAVNGDSATTLNISPARNISSKDGLNKTNTPNMHSDIPSTHSDIPRMHSDIPSVHSDIPSMHSDISIIRSLQNVRNIEQNGRQNIEEGDGSATYAPVAESYGLKESARMQYFKALMRSRLKGGESIADLAKDNVFDELLEICDRGDIFPANQKGRIPPLEKYRTLRWCSYLRVTKRNLVSLKQVILKDINDNLNYAIAF